ncbi:MAG: cupin domain-containing protein [Pseudomonadota bacterium]
MERTDLASRVVRREDYIPCDEAFVDTRLPGREGKQNYCIIGPGVAENEKQVVHIAEPHGFNVGGVSLPTGKLNSLHSHTTAEVFLVCRGSWRFFWGYDGQDGDAVLEPGDVISVPTGTFRGFESVGSDDNFMMSFLGEDDPGFVTWANDVIEGAAEFGFYLRKDSSLVDTTRGDAMPPDEDLLQPLSEAQLLRYNRTSIAEMAARVVNVERATGYTHAFSDCELSGGHKSYFPIIGEGCHESGDFRSPILNPHSFSLGAIEAVPGGGFLRHSYDVKQVFVIGSGRWRVTLEDGDAAASFEVGAEDTISVPAGSWRTVENIGDSNGVLYLASAGDLRVTPRWAPEVVAAITGSADNIRQQAGG